MIELLSASTVALAIAAVIGAVAIVIASRAATRAVAAERQLTALYGQIEAAIGDRIAPSTGRHWRDAVSTELRSLATASPRIVERRDAGPDWIAIALSALNAATRAVAALESESEPARIAVALGLAERLAGSVESVGTVATKEELEGAFLSGRLNDVLTTAPLIAGYFERNATFAAVIEAYALAAASLRLALTEMGIVVEIPAVLSTVSGREARGETMDSRELRRISQVRTIVNRFADRLLPGENLVLYCNVPGWRTRERQVPAALVFWNSASWLG